LSEYVAEATEAGGNLAEYLHGLVGERRAGTGGDLVSLLAQTEIDGERLDDEIAVGFLRHILNAAADTSYRTTGSLLVALLSDPALLESIRQDKALIPLAVEEALRWEGPVVSNFRTLTRDVVMKNVRMEGGAIVHAIQGSANRDAARFADPDKFDIHRSRRYRHLGFGGGPHICLGMQLARAQIREAVAALLDRLPGLRADPAEPPAIIKGYQFRRPHQLRVVFSP
jgi:cytochrome P450